jgi:hypothetical protein
MKRQPLVELLCNICYSCTVYTDELEFQELKYSANNITASNTDTTLLYSPSPSHIATDDQSVSKS